MNKKRLRLYLILALVILVVVLNRYNTDTEANPASATAVLVELQNKPLYYTKHAKCRMECRTIDQDEVEDILANGRINWKKSEINDEPCATYAIEGRTSDNQNVRIVYANCSRETKVVTTIDLDKHYDCTCD